VVSSYDYDSYGNIESSFEGIANPFTYTGREFDAESGLYYYRARYYDPATGRFINQDPIGFAAGDLNLYRYVFNNPINLIDPTGFASLILGGSLVAGPPPPVPGPTAIAEGGTVLGLGSDAGAGGIFETVGLGAGTGVGAEFVSVGFFTGSPEDFAGLGFQASAHIVFGTVSVLYTPGGDFGATFGVGPGLGIFIGPTFTTVHDPLAARTGRGSGGTVCSALRQ
jgi:RHS repeat-associated protein